MFVYVCDQWSGKSRWILQFQELSINCQRDQIGFGEASGHSSADFRCAGVMAFCNSFIESVAVDISDLTSSDYALAHFIPSDFPAEKLDALAKILFYGLRSNVMKPCSGRWRIKTPSAFPFVPTYRSDFRAAFALFRHCPAGARLGIADRMAIPEFRAERRMRHLRERPAQ